MYFICSDSYVYCTMDEYVDFLKENYTFRVDEDKRGMKVVFTSKDSLTEDGIIWFEPAKRGWSKNPSNRETPISSWMLILFTSSNS